MKKLLIVGMLISSLSFALGSSMKIDAVDNKNTVVKEKMEKVSDKRDEIQDKLSPADRIEFDRNNKEIEMLKAAKNPDTKKINVLSKKNEILLKQAKKNIMN